MGVSPSIEDRLRGLPDLVETTRNDLRVLVDRLDALEHEVTMNEKCGHSVEGRVRRLESDRVRGIHCGECGTNVPADAPCGESWKYHDINCSRFKHPRHRRCPECGKNIPEDGPCGESWIHHGVKCSRSKHPRGVPPPVMPPLGTYRTMWEHCAVFRLHPVFCAHCGKPL